MENGRLRFVDEEGNEQVGEIVATRAVGKQATHPVAVHELLDGTEVRVPLGDAITTYLVTVVVRVEAGQTIRLHGAKPDAIRKDEPREKPPPTSIPSDGRIR
jgi:hypothetical protein